MEISSLDLLQNYFLRVAPGGILVIGMLYLLPKRFLELRWACYLLLFILFRDAMTPVGLWTLGTKPVLWLRFILDWQPLLIMAGATAILVAFMKWRDPELWALLIWKKTHSFKVIGTGLIGAVLIALPAIFASFGVPLLERGGLVPMLLWPSILIFSLVGNCYEEILFRGFFQGYLEKFISGSFSILLSALIFSVGHIFLSATVTNTGWIVLAFTFYEGLIAAFLRHRYGLWSAVLSHGLGIALIASGLF